MLIARESACSGLAHLFSSSPTFPLRSTDILLHRLAESLRRSPGTSQSSRASSDDGSLSRIVRNL